MSERYLERTQFLPLPRSEVFAFFSDAGNLERITPEFLRFRILSPMPIEMKPGAEIRYRLQMFGIPFHWKTVIETWDPESSFTDVQEKGPYSLWHHTHEFHAVPGGTLCVDRVRYRLPMGVLGDIAHALFVKRSLRRIFDHRHGVIETLLADAAPAAAVDVPVGPEPVSSPA
ncbi:MAG: SRPBCC family protein [Planctomycetota bacterium]|jgi:ligand-binding SRPBCC domain-containing protein